MPARRAPALVAVDLLQPVVHPPEGRSAVLDVTAIGVEHGLILRAGAVERGHVPAGPDVPDLLVFGQVRVHRLAHTGHWIDARDIHHIAGAAGRNGAIRHGFYHWRRGRWRRRRRRRRARAQSGDRACYGKYLDRNAAFASHWMRPFLSIDPHTLHDATFRADERLNSVQRQRKCPECGLHSGHDKASRPNVRLMRPVAQSYSRAAPMKRSRNRNMLMKSR